MGKQQIIIIEIFGLIFFLLNQIFDIIIIAQGSFFNIWIKIIMYFVFFVNINTIFINHVPKEIIYSNYFEIELSIEQTQQQRQVITDYFFEKIALFYSSVLDTITAVFWYIILALTHMLILWFGLYKLYSINPLFASILSNFMFLSEQNECLILQKQHQQQQQLYHQLQEKEKQQEIQQEQQQAYESQQEKQKQQEQLISQQQEEEQQLQQHKEQQQQKRRNSINLPIQDENLERMHKKPHNPQENNNKVGSNSQKYKSTQIVPEQKIDQKNEQLLEVFDIEKQQELNEIKVSEKFFEAMEIMCYNFELTEKILLNFPQLILQIINCTVLGKETTGIQIASIVFCLLNILYNITLNVYKKNDELIKEQIKNMLIESSKILQQLSPYILMIEILQVIFYFFITVSYKWEDYLAFKDQETFGKDVHDSIRTFIILFPFTLLFHAQIIIKGFIEKSKINLKKNITLIIPYFFKDALIVQVCFDLLVLFKAPPFEYGQSIMQGSGNMKALIIIVFISQFIETILFYFKFIEMDEKSTKVYCIAYVSAIVFIIVEIKIMSHWVNLAHYYDWTNLDDKREGLICDHDLERTIRAYLILFFYCHFSQQLFLLVLVVFPPELQKKEEKIEKEEKEEKKEKEGGKAILYPLFCILLTKVVIAICYISFRANNEFCDSLQYVQKEEKALFIMHIIISVLVFVKCCRVLL